MYNVHMNIYSIITIIIVITHVITDMPGYGALFVPCIYGTV